MPRILVSEAEKTPQPYKIKLDQDLITLGRAAGNDLILTDPSTSSKHCAIRRVNGGFIVEDFGSTNGISLDDKRFKKLDLNTSRTFLVGDVKVAFTFTQDELVSLSYEDPFLSEEQPMFPTTDKTQVLTLPATDEEQSLPPNEEASTVKVEYENPYLKKQFSAALLIIMILLSTVAFVAGLSIKHYQEADGNFLLKNIFIEKVQQSAQSQSNSE